MSTRLRSFAKAVTYRVSGSVMTAGITLWATGKLDLAVGIGLLDITSKFVFYYAHERLWDHIIWGHVPECQVLHQRKCDTEFTYEDHNQDMPNNQSHNQIAHTNEDKFD